MSKKMHPLIEKFKTSEGRTFKVLPAEAIAASQRHTLYNNRYARKAKEMGLEGVPVVEHMAGMDTITINVTKADIKAGVPGDCHRCAFARSVIRNADLGEGVYADIGGMWNYLPVLKRVGKYGVCLFILKMRASQAARPIVDANDRVIKNAKRRKEILQPQSVNFYVLPPSHQKAAKRTYAINRKRKLEAISKGKVYFERLETITTAKNTRAKAEPIRSYKQPEIRRRRLG